MLIQKTKTFIPFDEHEELITALLAGRWWAVMEVEDLLRSSCEKGEFGDLPTDQEVEAPQAAPVSAASPEEAPVLARTLQGATAGNGSQQEATVPARPSLCRKLRVPENMRQYVTRNIILTPLPLRQPMGRPTSSRAPVPTASPEQSLSVAYPEDAPDLARTPEDTPMPGVSPKGAPLPAMSPLKSSVLAAYPEEAPVLTTSPEGAPLPARSSKGAHVPAASLEAAPVPVSSNQELPVPSRILKRPTDPGSQWEVSVLSRNLQEATVPDGSQQEATVPARPPWRQKLRVPEDIRQYLKRKSILTSLPIRQVMGHSIPAASSVQAPVPVASPEEAPVLARKLQGATAANGSQQGAPVPARPSLCRKLRVPENMRQYVTRNVILTPLPLRQPMGRPTSPRTPVPTASPEQPLSVAYTEDAPDLTRTPEDTSMSGVSPKGAPLPARCPEGAPLPARSSLKSSVLAAYSEEGPILITSPEGAPLPARSSKGAHVPAASLEEAPVPARSPLNASVPAVYHKEAPLLTPSPEGATHLAHYPDRSSVPTGSPEEEASLLNRSSKGAPVPAASTVEAPVPARSTEGAPMSCASPREVPVPPTSPEGAPVLSALQEEVPVPAASSERATVSTVPASSHGGSARPIRSHKRAHRLTTPPPGSPRKRSTPWSNEVSDNVGMVHLPPLKKQCMKEDCTASPSSQHNLKRLCPWTTADSVNLSYLLFCFSDLLKNLYFKYFILHFNICRVMS
ncbi:mucin-17-like [Carassius auratus]|uniref:Mucin-17-like n=1 Tax=Carassius auratus TaxID=7957 RepID=A0A6P6PP31_CARAU|nr:mucin-17-like [Carassius auratus]